MWNKEQFDGLERLWSESERQNQSCSMLDYMKRLEMQIIKILNNNVVISTNQEEIVLMWLLQSRSGFNLIEKNFILSADRSNWINGMIPEIIEIL